MDMCNVDHRQQIFLCHEIRNCSMQDLNYCQSISLDFLAANLLILNEIKLNLLVLNQHPIADNVAEIGVIYKPRLIK